MQTKIKQVGDTKIFLPITYDVQKEKTKLEVDEKETIKDVSPSSKRSFSVPPEIWLGSGLIAVWYISCYLFYLGYYTYYDIPFLYFDFDLNKVVTPSFLLLLFVFSPFFLLLVLRLLIYIYRSLGYWGVMVSSVVIAPILLYIVLFVLDWINLTYSIEIPIKLQMIYSLFVLVVFFLYWWITTKVGAEKVLTLLALVIFFGFLFYSLGAFIFSQQTTYPVICEQKNCEGERKVIIGTYRDFYVTTTYTNRGAKKYLTGKVELVEIKPDQVKEITKQTIEGNGKTTATGVEIVKSKELYVQKMKLGILYR